MIAIVSPVSTPRSVNPAATRWLGAPRRGGPTASLLVRRSGNDDTLIELATANALTVAAGHTFFVFLLDGCRVNVLAESEFGRCVVGVIDGTRHGWNPIQMSRPARTSREPRPKL